MTAARKWSGRPENRHSHLRRSPTHASAATSAFAAVVQSGTVGADRFGLKISGTDFVSAPSSLIVAMGGDHHDRSGCES
jgi:hypothetical protein